MTATTLNIMLEEKTLLSISTLQITFFQEYGSSENKEINIKMALIMMT